MQYTLQAAKAKDKTGVMRVLGVLAQNIRGHPFEDAFLHSLVTALAGMKEDFEAEDFCTAVFDGAASSSPTLTVFPNFSR